MSKNRAARVGALTAMVFAILLCIPPLTAQAEIADTTVRPISKAKGKVTMYLDYKYEADDEYDFERGTMTYEFKSGVVSNATSSNSKVANVSVNNNTHRYYTSAQSYGSLRIYAYKPGTTTIKYKYNGKARKLKVTVKDYVNPLKSLKLGSKEYAKEYNTRSYDSFYFNKYKDFSNKKFTVKAKKGWTVKEINLVKRTYSKNKKPYSVEKVATIKSGKKLPKASAKKDYNVEVLLQNKKTKGYEVVSFYPYVY